MTIWLMALAIQAAPYVKDPRFWPTPVTDSVAPAVPRLRTGAVLVLSKTNGFRDPEQIPAATKAIREIVHDAGRDVFATENAAVMNPRDLSRFRVVVLNSTSGTIFTQAQQDAFRHWVERGGGVVLLHGAGGDHHYDWDWYRDTLLGAQFIGHTSKPDQFQPGTINVVAPTHPVVAGLPQRWRRTEEWYSFDRVPSGAETRILAVLDEGSYRPAREQRMGRVHPMIWTRCVGSGRVVFSALGHKGDTYLEPFHRKLIGNAVRWAGHKNC